METRKRKNFVSSVTTGALGLALISLAACSSGDDTTGIPTSGGSAGFTGPLAFVSNTGDKTLTSVGLNGDSGNVVVNTIPAAEFENVALGDMQMSSGNWVFVNLTAAGKVAAIDPLTAATPIHRVNLPAGTRTVHIYRDTNNGEVIWSMNDGSDVAGASSGDDLVNCAPQGQVGGSVTVMHNSHLGPGANPPTVEKTICVLADGHKVAAFSSGDGVPKRVFVSSETGGEIAVIDDQEGSSTYLQLIHRIDLCTQTKEDGLSAPATCNQENPTGSAAFTPNNSAPHGIRWSNETKKIYSFQEGYGQFAEIDPTSFQVTKRIDLPAPYTTYGISPDGRYLLLRGETTNPQALKLGVIDLSATNPTVANLTTPELDGATIGTFATGSASIKFSPDGKRLYLLVGNSGLATVTKKDRLFAYDTSTLSATTPALTLLTSAEGIQLLQTGRHSMDVLAQGAREAKFVVVSNNGSPGSVSIINAADNQVKQHVTVGTNPGAVLVYQSGAAEAGNQASQ